MLITMNTTVKMAGEEDESEAKENVENTTKAKETTKQVVVVVSLPVTTK